MKLHLRLHLSVLHSYQLCSTFYMCLSLGNKCSYKSSQTKPHFSKNFPSPQTFPYLPLPVSTAEIPIRTRPTPIPGHHCYLHFTSWVLHQLGFPTYNLGLTCTVIQGAACESQSTRLLTPPRGCAWATAHGREQPCPAGRLQLPGVRGPGTEELRAWERGCLDGAAGQRPRGDSASQQGWR